MFLFSDLGIHFTIFNTTKSVAIARKTDRTAYKVRRSSRTKPPIMANI